MKPIRKIYLEIINTHRIGRISTNKTYCCNKFGHIARLYPQEREKRLCQINYIEYEVQTSSHYKNIYFFIPL